MRYFTALPLLATGALAFKVAIQSGTVCNGQTLADYTVTNDECFGFGSSTGHQASSAYVTYTGSSDENYVIEFFNTEDCTGPVIGEGNGGCLGLVSVGTPNSFRRNPVPNARRRAESSNSLMLGPHETWNKAREEAGLPPDDMPRLDDDVDEGFHWVAIWPGHWIKVASNMTITHVMDTFKFDHSATFPDLNFRPFQDLNNVTSAPTDVSTRSVIEQRDLVGTCSVLYYCSLPFFAARSAARIYQSNIAPIVNSVPVQFVWGAWNNGYVVYYNTNYFFGKTTSKVEAAKCSTVDSDKDEIISALTRQLVALQKQSDEHYESLGQCLLTNREVGVRSGSLSFDAWTTMVTATRCNTPDCST